MNKTYQLTKDGMSELKQELDSLIARRPEMAERIKTAREFGDLSENAEYQSARDEQTRDEARISELEGILGSAEVINKPRGKSRVELGSHVKLKSDGKTKEFQVVGTVEADPLDGKISDESPIGQALLGKVVGERVEIAVASDITDYKIVEIF